MKLLKIYAAIFLFSLCYAPLSAQVFTPNTDPGNPINTIDLRGFYRGCAWADIDNDGDLDLSLEGWALRNEGQDSFSIVTSFGSGPGGGLPDILGGVSWSDHDNDGDLDCLYSASRNNGGTFSGGTFIYDNDGNGNFTEKMIDSDINVKNRTWSAAWGNYNNDPYTDVTGAVAINFAGLNTPGFFYTGNQDGSFTKVDTFEFTQNTAPYTVAYWTDIDQDGDSDLMMASGPGGGPGPDFHYRNMLIETGTEGLQRITNEAFATDQQDGQCYNLIDHDLDGDLDLYLTNYSGALNRFYENQNGTFVSVTNNLVFGGPMLGNCWGDFDNDGDEDVLLTSDNISLAGYFENQSGVLVKVSNPFTSIFTSGNVSGLSIGDYDNDGDLDFFANGGVQGASGKRALYRNDLTDDNHWVQFDLTGTLPSNRSALGAQVWLKANIQGQDRWLHREVSAQNTFMGHNALRVHFGLGSNTEIDSLRIQWPSGNEEVFTNMPADSLYQITEGDIIDSIDDPKKESTKHGMIEIIPNPSNGHCYLQIPEGDFQESNITVTDQTGRVVYNSAEISPKLELDVSQWAKGVYNVFWKIRDGHFLGRLVVQ